MLFKKVVLGVVLLGASFLSQATLIDFDGLTANDQANDFYLADGVQFQSNDWLVTNISGAPTPNFATTLSGLGYVNISEGFTGQLSFDYAAFSASVVQVFDGANGTGSLLGSIDLVQYLDFTSFDSISFGFSGVGYSIVLQALPGQFAWDNLEFSNTSEVPAPAGLTLLAFGVALAFARRKDKFI